MDILSASRSVKRARALRSLALGAADAAETPQASRRAARKVSVAYRNLRRALREADFLSDAADYATD